MAELTREQTIEYLASKLAAMSNEQLIDKVIDMASEIAGLEKQLATISGEK